MKCPYCNKYIHALTGLQELQKFQNHLRACKKHPDRVKIVDSEGNLRQQTPNPDMNQALKIRHESGQ